MPSAKKKNPSESSVSKFALPGVIVVAIVIGGLGYYFISGANGAKNGQRIALPNIENLPDLSPATMLAQKSTEVGESAAGMQAAPQAAAAPPRADADADSLMAQAPAPAAAPAAEPAAANAPSSAAPPAEAPAPAAAAQPAAPPAAAAPAPASPPTGQVEMASAAPAAAPEREIPPSATTASGAGGVEPPYELRITATARQVWVWVSIDGGPLQATSLDRGESAEFKANRGYTLTVDDAGGVEATLNGKDLPRFGQPAQARRKMEIPSPELTPVG